MVLIVDGTSELIAHTSRKFGLIGEKKNDGRKRLKERKDGINRQKEKKRKFKRWKDRGRKTNRGRQNKDRERE